MRAGDSDRSAVIDLLRAHHLDGRLTVDEFEQRVQRAHVGSLAVRRVVAQLGDHDR